ncbi:MAG: right-handed parallel beta-helix repeat-containing protein, partial [Planctomycetota bacterium]
MFGSTSKARSANSFATASLIETLEPRVLFSATSVSTVAELTTALADISVTTINVAAGTYELDQALKPQDGQSIIGAGEGQTIITGASSWDPGIVDFKDPGIVSSEFNPAPYLFSFDNNTDGVTISNLTLTGSQLHGGITAFNADDLTIHDVTFDDFLWSGVRTFNSDNAEIYDNTFIDAGGRIGNTISGSVYLTNFKDSVFYDNETTITEGSGREVMGFKGRNVENIRIHHNTFDTNDFAIELPFENDDNVEIDHNFIRGGAVSIPKANGGPTDLPNAYHIHHNYFNNAAAVEFPRNGVEINNNLFD